MKTKKYLQKSIKSKKGSTLILVLVSLAIISIFASLILVVSLNGYRTKVNSRRSDDNFYVLEKQLDKIYTDLGIRASKIFINAYHSSLGASYMQKSFAETCVIDFSGKLKTEILQAYDKKTFEDVDAESLPEGKKPGMLYVSFGSFEIQKETVTIEVEDENGILKERTDEIPRRVVFKDVVVEHVNDISDVESYYNSVTTDIVITIPEIQPEYGLKATELLEYIYITDRNLKVEGNVSFNGNVYAGENLEIGSSTEEANVSARLDYLTTYKDLILKNGSFLLSGNSTDSSVMARNIITDADAKKAIMTLSGRIYVADDLEINAPKSVVTLLGDYVGMSNSNGSSGSDNGAGASSIVVNGEGSTLDMTSLSSIVLDGNAYLQIGRNADSGSTFNKMGEALALIVDQNLYQVHHSYVNTNSSIVSFNGVNYSFNDIKSDNGASLSQLIKNENYNLVSTGVKISDTGISDTDFVQLYVSGTTPFKIGTFTSDGYKYCYLYWNMNQNKVEDFADRCLRNNLLSGFLSKFLDLGVVKVGPDTYVQSSSPFYSFYPKDGVYASQQYADEASVDEYYISKVIKCYDLTMAELEPAKFDPYKTISVPEGTNGANAGKAVSNPKLYFNMEQIKTTGSDIRFQKYGDSDRNGVDECFLVVNGNLTVSSDGKWYYSAIGSSTLTPINNMLDELWTSPATGKYVEGYIICSGSVTVLDPTFKFKGQIVASEGLVIKGGRGNDAPCEFYFDSTIVRSCIDNALSSDNVMFNGVFGEKFSNENYYKSYLSGAEASFKISDVVSYEKWTKNKDDVIRYVPSQTTD